MSLNYIVSWLIVLQDTFHNISIISWQSILLMDETGVPEEKEAQVPGDNHRPWTSNW
jgi:hypothetical protein